MGLSLLPVGSIALLSFLAGATGGRAQVPSPPVGNSPSNTNTGGTGVEGTVTADSDGRPLGDAHVSLREIGRSADTDARGTFRIVGVPPGIYTLVVQKIGFGPAQATLRIAPAQILGADIELSSSVPKLERVDVTATASSANALADIETATRRVGATFIGRATLDSAHTAGRPFTNVLQVYARGVRMVQYSRAGAVLLSSGRGMPSMRRVPSADPSDPNSPKACFAQVVLDGVRIYTPDNTSTPVPDLSRYNVATIEAAAFYPGPATTPAEYGGTGASCGTLVIWTRR